MKRERPLTGFMLGEQVGRDRPGCTMGEMLDPFGERGGERK